MGHVCTDECWNWKSVIYFCAFPMFHVKRKFVECRIWKSGFTWNMIGWLSCWGWLWVCLPSPTSCCEDWCFTWNTQLKDPLQSLATHRGETTLSNNQPANQPTPPCFTWNHSSNTTKIYWTPRNNIRFPNLTHSCLLPANQEFTIHQHNHPHKQLWINSSVSRETLAFS